MNTALVSALAHMRFLSTTIRFGVRVTRRAGSFYVGGEAYTTAEAAAARVVELGAHVRGLEAIDAAWPRPARTLYAAVVPYMVLSTHLGRCTIKSDPLPGGTERVELAFTGADNDAKTNHVMAQLTAAALRKAGLIAHSTYARVSVMRPR